MANRAERQPVPQPPVVQQQGDERPFSPLRILEDFKRRHPEEFEADPHSLDRSFEILPEHPVRVIGPSGVITFPERKTAR